MSDSQPTFRFNFGKEESDEVQEDTGAPEYTEPAAELVHHPQPVSYASGASWDSDRVEFKLCVDTGYILQGIAFFTEETVVADGLTLVKVCLACDGSYPHPPPTVLRSDFAGVQV